MQPWSHRSPTTTPTTTDGRVTVRQALEVARHRLRSSDSARADAQRLLEATLERDAGWLLANGAVELEPSAVRRYETAVGRRAAGEPVAYILGTAGFYGRNFEVTRQVLVPRPETERLAELAIAFLRARSSPQPRFCDVGTGCGILAITLLAELPLVRGLATDVSAAALAVAKRNAAAHGVRERVEFMQADIMPAGAAPGFDCIVANLPYVPTAELAPPPDPTSFEPRLARDGGTDGLAHYRRLLAMVPPLLSPRAAVFMEAGPSTAAPLAVLARKAFGDAASATIHPDYAGLDRIVTVELR